ncbi:hypothetical protein D0Z08_09165 [Nocardioides immobilis]|uniref:HNH endonuclease n=1 Tax=Nocardioides immobilis TaxID=2049295 RepID=A0A417Y3S5_9ACTN|nr:HNH endonuclease signature motif containing protein [Nocardioides immobilis]RHW27318.1 hypothetical protein D0Z08_09165 [Nocardioides immobilis]
MRRATALGEIARHDLALDLQIVDPETGEITRTVPGRRVELIVHLNDTGGHTADGAVGRFANTRTPISPEQVKEWMGTPGTSVLVRPVIDLNGHQPVDSYEIPDRIRRQVTLADHHCTYPYCTRPAERCDLDHNVPHTQGGPTCRCNLNPKCRGHHRYKTSGLATCRTLSPGTYLWTLPSGLYLVDPTGTYDLTPDPAPPSRPSRRPTRPTHPTSSHRAPHPRHLVPPAGISACPGRHPASTPGLAAPALARDQVPQPTTAGNPASFES